MFCIEMLTGGATGRKHKHKVNQGNKSVMQISYSKVDTVSKLAKYVTRMKSQIHTSTS